MHPLNQLSIQKALARTSTNMTKMKNCLEKIQMTNTIQNLQNF